jgi:hypothetical protein
MRQKGKRSQPGTTYYESLERAVADPTPDNIRRAARLGLEEGYNPAVIAFTLWEMSTHGGLTPGCRGEIKQHVSMPLIEEAEAALRGQA